MAASARTLCEVSSDGNTKNLDDESGLYYFGARYYDPETGRFITKDPDGGDVTDPQSPNPYVYVKNNPLNLIDPDGQQVAEAAVIIGGGIGAITAPAWVPWVVGAGVVGYIGYEGYQAYRNWAYSKKARAPKPPGYGRGWTKKGKEWVSPKGERWRYHPKDKTHSEHWDVRIPKGKNKGKWRYNPQTRKWQKK